ncbi:LrgB family protein [Paracoccus sp. DMF-8]|uniref:LrgB family protein n=1 Tax=Paracoccus sp. DMF-8 TaxID=3019445 RepID=UPI0023E8578A|nr:LrgB family protein [Paracoccus sp. DMF-8]MDF3604961.1 LrgB family protein [Paracoccus sp. DMF-8]
MDNAALIWTYLSREPLLWLTATLIAYCIGDAAFRATGRQSWANPVLISVALLAALLELTATDYATYFEGAQFVHFMLGPATVCLGLPLYENLGRVKRAAWPLIAALVAGSATAVVSVLVIARAFDLGPVMAASLAPKSTTAPVAIGIAEKLGGEPTITATLVILTGIIGAIVATPLLNLLRITDWRARGFSVGVAAHGIGTARAFQVHETAGAFASVGMGMNAVLTAIIAPLALRLLG